MLKIADEIDPVAIKTVADRNERSTRTLDAVRELAPKIRAASDEIEQGRRLPLRVVEQMQRAGVFRMAMPRAWGGPELNLLSQLRVIEALSIADASAGWCAMIGVDGGYVTAYIDQTVAREMYADIDSVTAITFAPPGKAVKKETASSSTGDGRSRVAASMQRGSLAISRSLMVTRRAYSTTAYPKPASAFCLQRNAKLLIHGPPMACVEAAVTIGC